MPSYLKTGIYVPSEISLCLTIENIDFDVLQKKSEDFYTLIKSRKAQFPKSSQHLRQAFNLSQEHLKKIFRLPHKVSFEPYIKAFQFKVLNSILFTNTKLCKIGYISDDNCSFCKSEPEALYHVLFYCSHVQRFWKDFEYYFYLLTKEFFHLTLRDVMIGILYEKGPLLNYLFLIAKSFIWGCRRNQTLPNITAFKERAKIKYETEKFICVKTNCMDKFNKKWALCSDFATF